MEMYVVRLLWYVVFYMTFLPEPIGASAAPNCIEINSWDALRQAVFFANNNPNKMKRYGSNQQMHLLLCPFAITKEFDANTNHWLQFIRISKGMHIQCHKTTDTDTCSVDIVNLGPECNGDNCGKRLFKIDSDDVWIEGLTIKTAEDNVIYVSDNRQNIKLIDVSILNSRLPRKKVSHTSSGIIMTSQKSHVQVIDCFFGWNKSTVLTNRGNMLLVNSTFKRNEGTVMTKSRSKAGAVYNHGQLTIIDNTFDDNEASKGPAIYSKTTKNVYDAGGNCASNNSGGKDDLRCDGVWWKELSTCKPFHQMEKCTA